MGGRVESQLNNGSLQRKTVLSGNGKSTSIFYLFMSANTVITSSLCTANHAVDRCLFLENVTYWSDFILYKKLYSVVEPLVNVLLYTIMMRELQKSTVIWWTESLATISWKCYGRLMSTDVQLCPPVVRRLCIRLCT